jgi:diguanylate cyclase (GGDEF)-like protein
MARADEKERGPRAADVAPADPLDPLIGVLVDAAGVAPAELARRVREALPSAVGEIAESNRRLREAADRRARLVASAAAELRATAALHEAGGALPPRADDAARLRHLAEDLERSLRAGDPLEPRVRAQRLPGTKPRILVADDEEDAREALAQTLQDEYDVSTASDGQGAVDVARADRPDVVLMDVFMPHLDGLQALERMRADPGTADIPVIFVSAGADDAVKARSFELGAVDYLQKPFSDRELRARLERTLRLARSQTALKELAQTDPLTGLANLRAFRARLEEELKRARRYGTPLTCVMADMDQLKPVNDEFGHTTGDRAIAAVAAVIASELRETDFGARYGGDEFVLLLPHTSADDGRVLAERICARLRDATFEASGGRPVLLGASFGVACLPQGGPETTPEALVRAADAALYRAKRGGRGRVAVAQSLDEDA